MPPIATLRISPYRIPISIPVEELKPRARTKPIAPMTLPTTMAASNLSFLSSLAFMPPPHTSTIHGPGEPLSVSLRGRTFRHSSRILIECLAQGDIALLLRGPVAAAGNGAVHYQIVPVDEARFVAGKKHRGMGDVLGQPGARNRLRGLVGFAHHIECFLRRLDRETECLAADAGGDHARRNAVDADAGFAQFHRDAFGEVNDRGLGGAVDQRRRIAGKPACNAAVVDDAARALPAHMRCRMLHAQ